MVWIQAVIGPDTFIRMHVRPGSLPERDGQSEWQLIGFVGEVAVHDMVGQLHVRYRVRLVFRRGGKPPPAGSAGRKRSEEGDDGGGRD